MMEKNTKIDQDRKRYKKQLQRVTLEFNEGHLKEFYTSLFEKSSLGLFHITMVFKLLILAGVLASQIFWVQNLPGIVVSSGSLVILLSFWMFGVKCRKQLQTVFRVCHILTSTVVFVLIMQLAEGDITFTTLGVSSKSSSELASFLSIVFSLYQMVYVQIEVKWFFKAFLLCFIILLNIIFLGLDVTSSIIGTAIFVFILILLYQLEIVKKEGYFEVYRIIEDFQSLKTLINDILPMQVFVVQRNKLDSDENPIMQQQQQECLMKQQLKKQQQEQQHTQKVSQKCKILEENLQTVTKDIDTQERKENTDEIFKLKNFSRNFTNITGNSMQDGFFRTKTIDINTSSCRQNEKEDTDAANHPNISKNNSNNNSCYPLIQNKERTSILECKSHSFSKIPVKKLSEQDNHQQDSSNKSPQNGSTLKIAFANKLIHQDFKSDNLDEILAQLQNIQLPFPSDEQFSKNQPSSISKKQGNIYFSLLEVLKSKLQSEQSGKQPHKLPAQQQIEYKKRDLLSASQQPVKKLQQQLGTMKKQSMFSQQHKKDMLKMENSCKISNPQSSQRQDNLSAQGKEAQNEDSDNHSIQCGCVQSPQDDNHIVLDLPSLQQNPETNNVAQQNQMLLSHQKIVIHSDSALRNSSQAMFPHKPNEWHQCDALNPKRKLPLFFSKRINEFAGHDSSPALMSHPKNQAQPRTVPLTAFDSENKPNYPQNDCINKVQEFQSCLYKRKRANNSTDENDLEEKNYDIKLIECRWEGEDSVMVIMTNINERLMGERLLQIEQYKDSVIDIISHNLKTPLNCILAPLESVNSQLQSEKSQSPDSLQAEPNQQSENVKQVSMAINNCQLLLYMINDMIDYSQIIKGDNTFKLDLDHFKINYVVKVLKTLFEDQMHSKKIDFKIASSLDRSEAILFHDQRRLLQVLVNLISNSLKFTLKGTVQLFIDSIVPQEDGHTHHHHHHHHKHKLQSYYSLNNDNSTSGGIQGQMVSQKYHLHRNESVNCKAQFLKDNSTPIAGFENSIVKGNITTKKSKLQEKQIRFTLVDTGIGMSKEKLGRLRTMLLKRDNSLRITNSSGLGLTMCHSLIQRICCPNSYLEIESEENVGTRFTFTIQQFYSSNLALFSSQNASQPRIQSLYGFISHEGDNNNQSPKYVKSNFPSVPSLLFKQNQQKQQLQLENSQFSDKRGKPDGNMSYLSVKLQEAQTPSNSMSKESAFAQNSGADVINIPYITCQPKYANFKQESISKVLTEHQLQHEKEIILDSSNEDDHAQKNNIHNHEDRNVHHQGTSLAPNNELAPAENGLIEQKQSFLMYQMHIPSQLSQQQQYLKQSSIKNGVTPQNQQSQSQLQWLKRDNTINELGSFYSSITQRHTILFGGQSDKQLDSDRQQEKNLSSNNEPGDVSSSGSSRDSERLRDRSTSSKAKSLEERGRQADNTEELEQQGKDCEDNKPHSIEFQSNLAEHVSENKNGIQTSKYRFSSSRAQSFKKKSFNSSQTRYEKTPKQQQQVIGPCISDSQHFQSQHADKSMLRSLHRMLPHLQTEQNIDQTLEKLLANKHILIVDDTIYNILTLKILLRNAKDLLIEEAYNGRDALEKFQEKAIQNVFFDYIFMDIEMPIMNGLDCIQNIRCFEEANSLRRTIIITVTAYERDLEEILQAGANGLIAKPIQKEKFLQTLRFLSNQNQE